MKLVMINSQVHFLKGCRQRWPFLFMEFEEYIQLKFIILNIPAGCMVHPKMNYLSSSLLWRENNIKC
jgi:hypothetical protein